MVAGRKRTIGLKALLEHHFKRTRRGLNPKIDDVPELADRLSAVEYIEFAEDSMQMILYGVETYLQNRSPLLVRLSLAPPLHYLRLARTQPAGRCGQRRRL